MSILKLFTRFVLRNKILFLAWNTVVISPAINRGQLRTPVTVFGWSIRSLPFQCGGAPGIARSFFTITQAPEHVNKEQNLGNCYKDGCQCYVGVQRLCCCRYKIGVGTHFEVAAWHAEETQIVHRQINRISAKEGTPEV